ncbi:MAG: AAA family ATPase, partial [Candidatus Bathyarchaeota archaeon]|nr:AAA family ATPase [Candidatus Bathyarchaeota archaeon]
MRLLMINFEDILGLKGTINFLKGQPIIFYGENLAGKTNIINALRYCLIPKDPRRRKRTYSEEQRLTKDEMLLSPLKEGTTNIYFAQNEKLYRLTYTFKRTPSGKVRQAQRLHEAEVESVPAQEDKELMEFLKGLDWKKLDLYGVNEIANKIIEIGIYPEILDTLIAPSNVRNFSKTINKEIVTIPRVVSQAISTIRGNVGKYLKNLKTMNDILVLEKESCTQKLGDLQKNLTRISPKEAAKVAGFFSK